MAEATTRHRATARAGSSATSKQDRESNSSSCPVSYWCMAQRVQSGRQCKHFPICHRPATWAESGEVFCVLHLPAGQSVQELSTALNEYRQAGGCDFRYMVFPSNFGPLVLNNQDFEDAAIFREMNCTGLDLNRSRFKRDVIIEVGGPNTISLQQATVAGALTLKAENVPQGINMSQASVRGPTNINAEAAALDLRLRHARFEGPLHIKTFRLCGQWDHAVFKGGLHVRASVESAWNVEGSEFEGILDLQDCQFEDVNLSGAAFRACVLLDLTRARVRGDVVLTGYAALPKEIRLEGIVVNGNVRVKTELGAAPSRVIARDERPRFAGATEFTNVDLSECLLLGNSFPRFDISNISWARRFGRSVLFDEIKLRASGEFSTLESLRGANQWLKQEYYRLGDHVRSGDFHYAEMEAKRREYGWPWRVASWAGLYWLVSGYGTDPWRALGVLFVLILASAAGYWAMRPGPFDGSFPEALLFSVRVTLLQRPEIPDAFTFWGRLLHTAEGVLGPLQLALFGLALRMRLRR